MENSAGIRISFIAAAALAFVAPVMLSHGSVSAATINVSATCSLPDAVASANTDTAVGGCVAGAGDDTVSIPAAPAITLSTELAVTTPIAFVGAGMGTTIIDGGSVTRIINASAPISVAGLTLRNGLATGNGGAILSTSTVTVTSSTFSGSRSDGAGGAIATSSTVAVGDSLFQDNQAVVAGGAINASGVTVDRSTFVANRSDRGAALSDFPVVAGAGIAVDTSTFDSNISPNLGGALYTASSGSNVALSTFAANSATSGANVFIDTGGIVSLTGNILGAPAAGAACAGTVASTGANVSEEPVDTCGLGANDITATSAGLGPLQVNAPGVLPTRSIASTSPAIDRVPTADCEPLLNPIDQRGVARGAAGVSGVRCDSGSFELSTTSALSVAFTSSDSALTGQTIAFSLACPGVAPSTGSATINGAAATIGGLFEATSCEVVPTFPAGVGGPASFAAPVTVYQNTVTASAALVVVVVPPTAPPTTVPPTVPGVTTPGGPVIGGQVTSTTVAGAPTLPQTGSNAPGVFVFGCAMLLFGASLLILRRPSTPRAS